MVLRLQDIQIQQLSAHAERTYPNECCGLLLGRVQPGDRPADKTVVHIWETSNSWDAEAEAALKAITPTTEREPTESEPTESEQQATTRRYWIDPKDMLMAQRYARDAQLSIIGIYHSHPDHCAIPSECDRACAWQEYSYIIVSVQNGVAQDVLCWFLDEHHQFQPEKILTSA